MTVETRDPSNFEIFDDSPVHCKIYIYTSIIYIHLYTISHKRICNIINLSYMLVNVIWHLTSFHIAYFNVYTHCSPEYKDL